MIVTDITNDLDYPNCLRSQADEDGLTRSEGLHLTTIIRAIEETVRPRDEWCTENELAFFGAAGFMWERVFSMAMRDATANEDLVRPGEVTLDGIIGSPDLIDIPRLIGIDTKLTWKSAKRLDVSSKPAMLESIDRNFWANKIQAMSYAHMMGFDTWELHYFFVSGNWRPPIPCTKAVRLQFTSEELKRNWLMLVQFAETRGWL